MARAFYRIAFALSGLLFGLALVLYLIFDRAADAEQALSPGEDSLGVAVLAMKYGPWIVMAVASGLLSVTIAIFIWGIEGLRKRQ